MHYQTLKPSAHTPKTSSCRPLGAAEKMFWLCDRVQPIHFTLTAQIQGEFSSEQLKHALMQVQQRHPLLRVGIALDETEQPWFVEEEANIPLRIYGDSQRNTGNEKLKQKFLHRLTGTRHL
ncbi:MAG: hypothetical protein HC780_23825 [Leptolyngbyaceae cyanobacterium CSU_1_3]|nr:hypothetical protein [Leptolyngbyaceae cyanobacterium CSU_1_3]